MAYIGLVTLVVRDYDEAIDFYTSAVGFHLAEDKKLDDGKRWVMTLRENQWFHDGEKVLARDCAASLRRWMVRDPAGATLKSRLDAVEAPLSPNTDATVSTTNSGSAIGARSTRHTPSPNR